MRSRLVGALTLAIVALGLTVQADAAGLPLEHHDCGDLITHSFRLDNNLQCDENALFVGKKDITIDLNKHVIFHGGAIDELRAVLVSTFSGVTVRNGTIRGFDQGVVTNGRDTTVEKLTILGAGTGIDLFNAKRSSVTQNFITSNSPGNSVTTFGNGIVAGGDSQGTLIERNTVLGVDRDGILNNSPAVTISGNTVRLSGEDGIDIANSEGATVASNVVEGNTRDGIHMGDLDTTGARITGNTSTTNGRDGIVLAGATTSNNVISGNTAENNTRNGINIGGGTNNRVKNNKAHHNGEDGIKVQVPDATITDNKAFFNGAEDGENSLDNTGLGINGTSGNEASNNKTKGNLGGGCDVAGSCDDDPDVSFPADEVVKSCNSVINASFKLGNNLVCAVPAFTINATNVTIDLNGHHISHTGVGVDDGIINSAGHSNFLVTNGVMRDWKRSIFSDGGTGIGVSEMTIRNDGVGVRLESAQGPYVTDSTISGTADATTAIDLTGSASAIGDRNTITSNSTAIATTNNDQLGQVNDNKLVGNGTGVFVQDAGGDVLRNTMTANTNGILVNSVLLGLDVIDNTVTANSNGMVVDVSVGNAATIAKNLVQTSRALGFDFSGTGNLFIKKNLAKANGSHGFFSDSTNDAFTNNVAKHNGFGDNGVVDGVGRGYEAPGGAAGSTNSASGNDDTVLPCNPQTLCAT